MWAGIKEGQHKVKQSEAFRTQKFTDQPHRKFATLLPEIPENAPAHSAGGRHSLRGRYHKTLKRNPNILIEPLLSCRIEQMQVLGCHRQR